MTLAIDAIRDIRFPAVRYDLNKRDIILYALGLGFGDDPLDEKELSFVFERGLQTMPTLANAICHPGFWAQTPAYGIDWVKLLHAEQELIVHGSLPGEGRVRGETVIEAIEDKGADKGALLHQVKTIYDDDSNVLLATVRQTLMLRGNGGQGGFGAAFPVPDQLPDHEPDRRCRISTRSGLALLYRLNGDWNPLHADPAVARAAGFDRPILHGLCVKGIAARAVVARYCAYDASRLRRMFVRFSRPVLPGDTLEFDFFETAGRIVFRARAVERGVTVLDRCHAVLE